MTSCEYEPLDLIDSNVYASKNLFSVGYDDKASFKYVIIIANLSHSSTTLHSRCLHLAREYWATRTVHHERSLETLSS